MRLSRTLAVLCLAAPALAGCGRCDCSDDPYVVSRSWDKPPVDLTLAPATNRGLGGVPRTMVIGYSGWLNTEDQIRRLVAEQCGPTFSLAQLVQQPYRGNLLHPQQAEVTCLHDLPKVAPDTPNTRLITLSPKG